MKKLAFLLLIAHFFKQLFWLAIIPIWHFPDEEQHFAQTAFFAEKGRFPKSKEFDVTQEIDQSSEILGTKREGRGVNKFTYHPEYRIPYIKGEIGLWEEEVKALNKKEIRQKMVKREAARYGPIYYFLTAVPYKLFFEEDLFVRLFASRFISIILSTLTVLIVYLIAKEIFKDERLRLTLTFLVSFQPMFSFVGAGVSSDNFFNLIFILILFLCLKIFFPIKTRSSYKNQVFTLLLLAVSLILGFYTKRQIFIALPIIIFGFLISLLMKNKKAKKQNLAVGGLLALIFLILLKGKEGIPEYDPNMPSKLKETFFQYIFWHLKHTIAETIPWYWGVFNWLGVTLPRWLNRIQSRILVACTMGIFIYFVKQIKEKKFLVKNNLRIVFLLGTAGIYYFSVIIWDYFFRQSHGFSFGIQGRYFFPTIVSHMLFILLGLLALIPKKFKLLFVKVLNIWWLFFSLVGLHTAIQAYYQIWPFMVFLNQASQYKPDCFKGLQLAAIFLAFLLLTLIFIFTQCTSPAKCVDGAESNLDL